MDNDEDSVGKWFVCISNTPRIYNDGSSDEADLLLTVGKSYYGSYGMDKKNIFIGETDKGGFPTGHRWIRSSNFKLLSDIRDDKLNQLGI